MHVNVHAAETQLSTLIEAGVAGEDVVIARDSTPVVRLVPVRAGAFKFDLLADRHARVGVDAVRVGEIIGGGSPGHRDPFDRLLASTSLATGVPLVSANAAFDVLTTNPDRRPRIW